MTEFKGKILSIFVAFLLYIGELCTEFSTRCILTGASLALYVVYITKHIGVLAY